MTGGVRLLYRFGPDVRSVARQDHAISIDVKDWKVLKFQTKTTAHSDAVVALQGAGATLARLGEIAAGDGELAAGVNAAAYYVERFSRARLLTWELSDALGRLAGIDSLTASYRPREDAPPAAPLVLDRFAYLRRSEEGDVLESGVTRARIRFDPRGTEALARSLSRPRPAAEDAWAEALWRLGFFDVIDPPESEARRTWEFHDLVMHETSRFNRDDTTRKGGYRFDGKFAAPPAVKPPMSGVRIALPPVDEAKVRAASGSLYRLQAERRSLREYAEAPLPLSALGEFLWRVGRTQEVIEVAPHGQELQRRPYPAGGSIHELEYYVAVSRCEGLEPAFYHYDSHGHALVRLANTEKIAPTMIEQAASAMALAAGEQRPHVAITIASRLPRLAWKYERIAYRASLLNTGVVFQLMYLIATDMKLAACGNGSGDSRLFEKATGLDLLEETAIGEFCLSVPVEG